MKTLDIVHIVWRDALSNTLFWEPIDDAISFLNKEIDLMETVGQVIKIDKRYVTVVSSVHYNSDGESVKVGGVFSIPKGCIVKMRKISGPIKRST